MFVEYLVFFLSLCSVGLNEPLSTKCKYKFIENGVPKADRDLIVQQHNDFRKLIANGLVPGQPRGIDLKKLKWDNRLAKEAQIVADSCVFGAMQVDDNRFHVGQNSYKKKSTEYRKGAEWNRAVDSWIDNRKQYRFGSDFTQGGGQYTQLVWANTEYIGCGYTFFETPEAMKYHKVYVCNYGPGGNYVGNLPYKAGDRGCEELC